MNNDHSLSPEEIAARLHDDLCQRLAGLTYRMAMLDKKLTAQDSTEAAEVSAIYAELRKVSSGLRQLVLDLQGGAHRES